MGAREGWSHRKRRLVKFHHKEKESEVWALQSPLISIKGEVDGPNKKGRRKWVGQTTSVCGWKNIANGKR